MTPAPRYYVRVGADVRGPVDEQVVIGWIAQGMRQAGVCVEGAPAFVPVEQTHFARYMHDARRAGTSPWTTGRITLSLLLPVILIGVRLLVFILPHDKKELAATLPAVGAAGTLEGAAPIQLCAAGDINWGWPCRDKKTVAGGSHVQLAKAGVQGSKTLCRYWIQGGPDDRFVGDGPCAVFKSP